MGFKNLKRKKEKIQLATLHAEKETSKYSDPIRKIHEFIISNKLLKSIKIILEILPWLNAGPDRSSALLGNEEFADFD